MIFPAPIVVTVLLTVAVSANPLVVRDNLIRLPFAKRFNATGVAHVLRIDQARAKALHAHGLVRASGPVTHDVRFGVQNQAVAYAASVAIGVPPTNYSLLIDTGSSNTWIGAKQKYVPTSTSKKTPNTVDVSYGSGFFHGNEFVDHLSLASGLVITEQSIGIATDSQGFGNFDGILGLGPVDLTIGTLSPANNSTVPTVTDNLYRHGSISANKIAISFEPTTQPVSSNGEITFGGIDNKKFTGVITFTAITNIAPSNEFWGIDQTIRYGASTPILSRTAGIVDTGTTLIMIATDAFKRYRAATGATPDPNTGLLKLSSKKFSNLKSLFFEIAGTTFELTANAQAWPRSLNTLIGGKETEVYLIVADIGTNTGFGLDFINGFAFLERFYSVFDSSTGSRRVGLATTPFTKARTN